MLNKTFYKSVSVMCESEFGRSRFMLNYYILKKDIKVDGFSVNTYGIEIEKRSGDGGACLEYRRVYDVFCTMTEAVTAINKMIINTVTPTSLIDVLEDMIGIGNLVNEESMLMAI